MTLSEFINKTDAKQNGKEWVVTLPLYDGTTGKLFVNNVDSEFEAKEMAFTYLNDYFERKHNAI